MNGLKEIKGLEDLRPKDIEFRDELNRALPNHLYESLFPGFAMSIFIRVVMYCQLVSSEAYSNIFNE